MRYRQFIPSPRLATFVAAFWLSDHAGTDRVLPDGSSDLLWFYDGHHLSARYVGPMTTAAQVIIAPGCYYIGVRFKPGVLLRGQVTSLAQITDHTVSVAGQDALTERLYRRFDGGTGVLNDLETWLGRLVGAEQLHHDPTVDDLLCRINADPLVDIQSLYRESTFSARTIQRRFLQLVGLSPKMYARVQRLHRTLDLLRSSEIDSLAALSLDMGFSDQAHFTREIKALTGMTPGTFRSR